MSAWTTALRRTASVSFLAASVVASGCGDDDATGCTVDCTSTDAGPGAGSPVVAPPDIPWLADGLPPVALTPCPENWHEATDEGGVTVCDPYPEGGPTPCPDGQAWFVGEPGCAPIGAACPTGDFSDDLPTDVRVVYIRPGATGGDGTQARPYGGFSELAFGPLPIDTVVALGAGTHEGPVRLSRGHTLWGACAERTALRATVAHATDGVVTLVGAGGLRDLTVAPSPRTGVRLSGDAVAGELDGVAVVGVAGFGIFVRERARLSARALVVRDTASRAGAAGWGLGVQTGGVVEVTRAIVSGNEEVGAFAAEPATTLMLTDAVLRDTVGVPAGEAGGRGVNVQGGAAAQLERVLVSGNREIAVAVSDADASLTMTQSVVRDTRSDARDGAAGWGLSTQFGATLDAQRVLVSHSQDVGVYSFGAGTNVGMSDVVVRDTSTRDSGGTGGYGFDVEVGARVTLSNAILERNTDTSILVSEGDATITMSDVVVRDTRPAASDESGGRGLNVQLGGIATVERALFELHREVGVLASAPGSAVTLTDVVVRDTRGRIVDDADGRAVAAQREATLQLSRVLVERAYEGGVLTSAGAALTASDLEVRDVESELSSGRFGRGMSVEAGATARVSRAVFSRNAEIGVGAFAAGDLHLEDVLVQDTHERACAASTCPGEGAGHGITSYEAAIRITGSTVERSRLCGLHLALNGTLDITDSEVRENQIGACVQVDGFDPARLTDTVRYVDNEVNLQTTTLPIPEPIAPAGLMP